MKHPKFELKPHEEILEVVHQSLVPIFWKFVLAVMWLLIPFFFLFPLFREGTIGIVGFFLLVSSGIFILLKLYLRWFGTVLILTDKRVVDIDQRGFFDRVVTEVPYHQIDEASYRVKGFWSTVFRYGSIRLDLSGKAADIQFDRVSRPSRIYNLLNDLREETSAKAHLSVSRAPVDPTQRRTPTSHLDRQSVQQKSATFSEVLEEHRQPK